jgi:hypothetical protein
VEEGATREVAVEVVVAARPAEGAAVVVGAQGTSAPTLSTMRADGVVVAVVIAALPRCQAPPREAATSSPRIRRPLEPRGEVATLPPWLLRVAGSR